MTSQDRRRPGTSAKLAIFALLMVMTVATGVASEEPARGFFGLTPRLTQDGVKVVALTPGGPAETVGIREGDVIVLLNGKPLVPATQGGVIAPFTRFREGDRVEIVVRRDGDLKAFRLTLDAVPPLTREEQERVEALERKIRASRVVEEMLATLDTFELSFSKENRLLFRESPEDEWQVLEPEVAKTFEGVARHFLKDRPEQVLRLKVKRGEGDSLELVVVGSQGDSD